MTQSSLPLSSPYAGIFSEDPYLMTWNSAVSHAEFIRNNLRGFNLEHLADPAGSFLDIGCGDGKLLAELRKLYPHARFSGLSSHEYQDDARENNPQTDIKLGYFQDLPFLQESITIATASNILDYAAEVEGFQPIGQGTFTLEELSREVHRVLIPGGVFFLFDNQRKILPAYKHVFSRFQTLTESPFLIVRK